MMPISNLKLQDKEFAISPPTADPLIRLREVIETNYSFTPKEKGFNIPEIEGCTVEITTGLLLEIPESLAKVQLDSKFLDKETNEQLAAFSADFIFHVINFSEAFTLNKDEVTVPDSFLLAIVQIALGTTRGMLIGKTKGSYLEKIYLPLINPVEVVNSLKAQMAINLERKHKQEE